MYVQSLTNWVWVILLKKKSYLVKNVFFSLRDFTLGDNQVIERWIFFSYQLLFISLQFCFYSGDHE